LRAITGCHTTIGTWTADAQSHNDKLIARQKTLGDAWNSLKGEEPSDWAAAWDKKRREALAAGGFEVVF